MRIQHNIMAMNAYRNYTNNTSALSKNLEKLSSGYRINRAGDDAAGLAISEKMRAQITALGTAQKNVKDGISLVKTAEGATQEVHDMLNRMVELATQSANGTYQDLVDRDAIELEFNELKTEINRIADSANFNGIKLLDGSLDGSAKAAVEASTKTASGMLPDVGQILGKDTVLHAEKGDAPEDTTMSVDLHNTEVTGTKGQTFTINVGGTKLTGTLQKDCSSTALSAADIADALANGTTTNVSFAYADGTAYSNTSVKFGEGEFKAEAGATATTIKFTQTNADDVDIAPDMEVTLSTGTAKATEVATSTSTDGTDVVNAVDASFTVDLAGITDIETGKSYVLTIAGQSVQESGNAGGNTAADLAAALNGKTVTIDGLTYTAASTTGSSVLTFTSTGNVATTAVSGAVALAKGTTSAPTNNPGGSATVSNAVTGNAQVAATAGKVDLDFAGKTGKDVLGGTIEVGDKTYEFVEDANDVQTGNTAVVITKENTAAEIATALAGATAPSNTSAAASGTTVTFTNNATGASSTAQTVTIGKAGGDAKLGGDYNKSTTKIEKKAEAAGERLASTYFDLTKDMAGDGNKITIGKTDYTFTTDKSKKNDANTVYVGDLDLSKAEDMITAAERLTMAAKDNATYTVGHDGKRMTFTENKGQTAFVDKSGKSSLTELEEIEKSFGFYTAAKEAVAADPSKALTLQIGEDSESYNQMKVSIGDMHVDALGIDGLTLGNQTGAQAAVSTIKDAINYVSNVRSTLGATQNRLEHTANNLSVMEENIQDAESTIRDTDIAEEMMAYTKNNILVQSAQAMLAQANQVPQGVLQLLG